MSTRLGFRPRPVDPGRQLNIVRDENELDNEDAVKEQLLEGIGAAKVCSSSLL